MNLQYVYGIFIKNSFNGEILEIFDALNTDNNDLTFNQFSDVLTAGKLVIRKFIVEKQSLLEGVQIRNSNFPKNVLIGPLIRNNEVKLADGNTVLQNDDILILIGKTEEIEILKGQLKKVKLLKRISKSILKVFKKH